jgi:hypothetical protein
MKTGRDLAAFITKHTGEDYVGLYDAAVEEEEIQMENTKKNFNNLVERINESDKKRFADVID